MVQVTVAVLVLGAGERVGAGRSRRLVTRQP